MQIQFPRRVQMGFRPWYGLTLRQLGYLAVTGVGAGALVLFGPVEGGGLITRVLIGLGLISIGVALAFFRKDGMTVEQWLVTRIKFLLRPHQRVWTRGEDRSARDQTATILIDTVPRESDPTTSAGENESEGFPPVHLLHPTPRAGAASSAVIVLVDMAVLLALFALGVYLARGGLAEIQNWFAAQWRR